MGCCEKRKEERSIEENKERKESEMQENITKDQDEEVEKESDKEAEKDINRDSGIENIKLTYNDFEALKLLGTGSFGRVLLVRFLNNNNLYAMKILSKDQIKLRHQEEHTKTERDLMVKVNSPFIVNIKCAFQDENKLYIVSDFMQGGDMFYHLHSNKKFDEKTARFYLIEIILALEFLHKNNMIYRDLKPENILMDSNGHLKISDFGLSKILDNPYDKAYTLCGTPQYLAPEILKNQGYDKTVDWWSLGCLLYEMVTGILPFYIPKGNKINPFIFEEPLQFPSGLNPTTISLIKELLTVNPKKRLGYGKGDANSIKSHEFFKDIDWEKYMKKEIKAPFIPDLEDELDLKYFDKMFTEEPIDSDRPSINTRTREHSNYKGFTYVTNSVQQDIIKTANLGDIEEENQNDV